jgi:hypothetical protein
MSYLLYAPFSKNYMAFPKESAKNIDLKNGTTIKKKAINGVLKAQIALGLNLFFLKEVSDFELFDDVKFSVIETYLKEKTSEKLIITNIIWNREYSRQRVYLWAESANGEKYFIKVLKGLENASRITNEYEMLTRLSKESVEFNSPALIHFALDIVPLVSIIVTEAIDLDEAIYEPIGWEIIFPSVMSLYSSTKKQISTVQITKSNWFCKSLKSLKNEEANWLLKTLDSKSAYSTSFQHGDLGSENSFVVESKLWLIDWENASYEIPFATDCLANYIMQHDVSETPLSSLLNILSSRLNESISKEDVLLSLVYLLSNNFNQARPYLDSAFNNGDL